MPGIVASCMEKINQAKAIRVIWGCSFIWDRQGRSLNGRIHKQKLIK